MAERAMRFVATPGATEHRGYLVAGVLLADHEMNSSPLHVTVVGRKDDPKAQVLFGAVIRQPTTYKRIEWFDEREGALPNPDVGYPTLREPRPFFAPTKLAPPPLCGRRFDRQDFEEVRRLALRSRGIKEAEIE